MLLICSENRPQARPHHWLHTCHAYDASSGRLRVFLQGEELPLDPIRMEQPGGDLAGVATLARVNIGRSPAQSGWFIGRTADLHIYNRAVTQEEAARYLVLILLVFDGSGYPDLPRARWRTVIC